LIPIGILLFGYMELIKSIIGIYFNVLSYLAPKFAGKQSFYFFCIPFKAKLKPKHQAFLNTAIKKELSVDGQQIMSYCWGNGPKTILFVHGWQSNTYRWKQYIDKVDKTKYKILAFDAPGHGNSEGRYSNVPLYERAMKQVVNEYGIPSIIVSHSIGAFASMYFLHKHKISLDRFVSLATPFTAIQFVDFFQSELKLSDRAIKYMKAHFDQYAGHPPEYFSLDKFAGSIDAQCLLIHDEGDTTTSVENSQQLHRMLKDSELDVTEGFGHGLRNKWVIKKTLGFIEDAKVG